MRTAATTRTGRPRSTCWLLLIASAAALGCADDSDTTPPCKWVYDRDKECPLDEGTGETGGEPDDEASEQEPCSVSDGTEDRTVFQCAGTLRASLDFSFRGANCGQFLGDKVCNETHDFGDGFDGYDAPKVMACCDLEEATDDDLLTYCAVDLVEQLCHSMPVRIDAMMDTGEIPAIAHPKARRLRDYMRTHQQDCYDALYRPGGAPGALEPGVWQLPEGKWSPLESVSVKLDYANVEAATTPDDGDESLTCLDASFNNTEVFEETILVPPNTGNVLALHEARGSAQVRGPSFADQRIVGAGELAGDAGSLKVTVSAELPVWTLHEFAVQAAGPVEVHYGDLTVPVERAAIRLYGVSQGHSPPGARYTINPGDAHFVISGVTHGDAGVRWARNRTPIVATPQAGAWVIDAFELEHVDSYGYTWTVTVPTTDWR